MDPPVLSQREDQPPVLMPSTLSTLQQWFARARLLDPHLTRSRHAVSASLTTPALNRRSMRWFEATPCRAAPEGLPPSPAQLLASAEPDLHRLLPSAHAAHDHEWFASPSRPSHSGAAKKITCPAWGWRQRGRRCGHTTRDRR